MFITIKRNENIIREELVSIYKSKYIPSIDVITPKRTIIIHNDLDINRSTFEGIHTIKTTIINLSVLDGKYHYDAMYQPDLILVKTIYNGYMVADINSIKGNFKLTETLLSESHFRLSNAYTSYIGLWSVYEDFDHFTPLGISFLDMIDLKNATMHSRNHVSIYGGEMSLKIEVTFDGDTYQTVLPIPHPQYYSRLHSVENRDDPIITRSIRMSMEDICDEFTKVTLVDFDKDVKSKSPIMDYRYEDNINSSVEYFSDNGRELVVTDRMVPMHIACNMLRSLCDDLYSKFFKIYSRYQLSSLNFIYDSARKKFVVPSMTFSFKDAPKDFAKTVSHEILEDSALLGAFDVFHIIYGPVRIFGRITDLKYDLTIFFINGHKEVKELKSVKYHISVFDIMNSLTNFETNIKSPITSI